MSLPVEPQLSFDVRPIDWEGVPKRYMNPGELEALCALARWVGARRVMEIGCNEGRTAKVMLREVEGIEYYLGVDVPRGYAFAKPVQRREVPAQPGWLAQHDPRFELIVRPRGSMDLHMNELPVMDLVFIDGDHSREAVEHDTQLARSVLRPGGLIVWHDYHDKGTVDVKSVLDDLRAAGRDIRQVENTWLAFERMA